VAAERHHARQEQLRRHLEEERLDALLVTVPVNLQYLTGFTGSAGLLLIGPGVSVLITDFRYASQAPEEVGDTATIEIESVNLWGRLTKVIGTRGNTRLAFDRETTTVRDAERIAALPGVEPVAVGPMVEHLRMVKDESELAALQDAVTLAQDALAALLPTIHTGQTEIAVAAALEHELRLRGSEWHPFPTIVASGPRSALPHARSTDRTIGAGEWLLLDFGARVRGYCADLTRTVVVGARADQRQREVYEVVRQAQRSARARIRAGMSGREADALARDVITAAGFGPSFGHSLGHGIGLEVHEAPRLARAAEDPLPEGAVVTIEPGIYLEGWGGIRLEDDVHLAAGGPRCLSNGRTELLELV
jgi:Xaa-Pro aminopeptidase